MVNTKYENGPVPCGFPGCKRTFLYTQKHQQHLKKDHGERTICPSCHLLCDSKVLYEEHINKSVECRPVEQPKVYRQTLPGRAVRTTTLKNRTTTRRAPVTEKKSTVIQAPVTALSSEEAINSMLYQKRLPVVSQLIHHTLLFILTRRSFVIPTSFNIGMKPLTIENDKFTMTLGRGDAEVLRSTPAGDFWLLRNYLCHGGRGSIFVAQSPVKRFNGKKHVQTRGQLAAIKIMASKTQKDSTILVQELKMNDKLMKPGAQHSNLMIPREIFVINSDTNDLLDLDSANSKVNFNLHGFIIMELADFGTLNDVFLNWPASMDQIKSIFRQLFQALKHLHSVVGISHNDVKPENILLFRNHSSVATDSDGADLFTPKLTDFSNSGLLKEMPEDWTPGYTAPEVLMEENFDNGEKSDVYSMWLCLLYALCGYPFFKTVKDAEEQANKQTTKLADEMAKNVTERLRKCKNFGINVYNIEDLRLIETMSKRVLRYNADRRPTVEEILSDEFFL